MSRLRRVLPGVVGLLAIVLLALPPAVAATVVLMPLWSRIEASTGIESVGHSGPATWCYLASWVGLSALLAALAARVARRRANALAARQAAAGRRR